MPFLYDKQKIDDIRFDFYVKQGLYVSDMNQH